MVARKLRSNFFLKKSTNSFISWLMFSTSSKMDSVFFPWGGPQKIEILNFWEKSIPFYPELTYHKLSQPISEPPLPPSHSPSQTPLRIILNPTPSQPILTHYHPYLSQTIPTYTEPSQNIPNYPEPSPPIQNHPHLY